MANDAGTAYIDVKPELKGFGRDLAGGIDPHVDRSAKNVESRFGGAFASVAKVAGGLFAAKLGVDAFKDVIGGASDLNETISKSNTIFGSNAKEIEAWAGTAAKSMGQSKQGALDAAATFGNLFVQLGTGSGEAAKMSKQMVGLASDFASFHNADPTDVIESMTAAFRGEYDAVQKYVPTINAAAVEQEALKMGLAKTTKELTAQDKALATQSLLMSGAGAAVGDFAKTSDGLANRQRILAAQFQDTKDKIGTALLPVVLTLMESFLKLGAAVSGPLKLAFDSVRLFIGSITGAGANVDVGSWMNPIIDAGARVRQVFDEVSGGIRAFIAAFKAGDGDITSSGFAGAMERIGNAARTTFDFLRDNALPILAGLGGAVLSVVVPAFVAWATTAWAAAAAQLAVIAPAVAIGVALFALGAAVVYAYQNFEGFRTVIDAVAGFLMDTVWPKIQQFAGFIAEQFGNLVGFVQQHWGAIQEAISHVVNVVREVIETFIGVVQAAWKAWGDELVNVIGIVWDQIRNVVETVVGIISGVISAGLALINGEWGAAWDAIKGVLATAWEFIRETIVNALRLAREAVEGGVSAIVALVGEVPGQILGALGDLAGLLYNAGRSIMEGLGRGIKDAVQGVYDFVSSIAGKIASLKGPIEKDKKLLIPAGEAIMDGLVRGLRAHEGLLVTQLAHTTGLIQSVGTSAGLSTSTPLAPSLSAVDSGSLIDYDRLAAAINRNPVRSYVVASDVARGLHDGRRR